MSVKEIVKRYTLFVICLFVMGLGVALTKQGALGVSPISSLANVASEKFSFFSIGDWLFVTNVILIIGQVLILRKNFKLIQLLQIPFSFLFGWFTDFGVWLFKGIPNGIYAVQMGLVILGTVVLGFGITLGVVANVVLNSGEAFVKAISDTTKKDFGNVKVVFDVSLVVLSVVLSLILFSGKVIGVREGTVISALFVGFVVKFFRKLIAKPLTGFLTK